MRLLPTRSVCAAATHRPPHGYATRTDSLSNSRQTGEQHSGRGARPSRPTSARDTRCAPRPRRACRKKTGARARAGRRREARGRTAVAHELPRGARDEHRAEDAADRAGRARRHRLVHADQGHAVAGLAGVHEVVLHDDLRAARQLPRRRRLRQLLRGPGRPLGRPLRRARRASRAAAGPGSRRSAESLSSSAGPARVRQAFDDMPTSALHGSCPGGAVCGSCPGGGPQDRLRERDAPAPP